MRTTPTATALVAALVIAGLGAGCSSGTSHAASASQPTPTSSSTPNSTPTSTPASTPSPTASNSGSNETSTTAVEASSSRGAATACTLVTVDEATTALGSASGPGVLKSEGGSSRCVFGDGALDVFLGLDGKSVFDRGRAALAAAPAGTWSDIPDLGDAAYASHGGPVVSLELLKGRTLISIILSGSTAAVPTDSAVKLARSALARL